jgi:hypothetical protein
MRVRSFAIAAALAGATLGAPAQATTATESCSWTTGSNTKTVVYTLTSALDSSCGPDNNDSAGEINDLGGLFAGGEWTLGDKREDDGTADGGNGVVSFSTSPVDGGTSWEVSSPGGYALTLVLKQGSSWAAFLLDGLSGSYSVSGPSSSDSGDISHSALYYRTSAIPLPAGALLIMSALALAGVVRRRSVKG